MAAAALAGALVRRLDVQPAEDHDVLPEWLERREGRRKDEIRPFAAGRPLVHDSADGKVHVPDPHRRADSRVARSREGRNHRVQQRQCDRRTEPAKEGATVDGSAKDHHDEVTLRI
jgi:hypothetical protein